MTDNYLLITKVTDFDAGSYLIKASNDINVPAEEQLHLIVFPLAPTLAINAEKTLFEIGDDVMLPCEIKGYPVPEIRWYKITYKQGRREEILIKGDDLGTYFCFHSDLRPHHLYLYLSRQSNLRRNLFCGHCQYIESTCHPKYDENRQWCLQMRSKEFACS